VSFSDSPLSPELQKLITDVFTLKFTNTNPQTSTHFTDTLIPQQTWLPVQLANGAPPVVVHITITPIPSLSGPSSPAPTPIPHLNVPPVVTTVDSALTERAHLTGSSAIDTTSGTISFADINLGDRPTAKATISSFTYQNAQHQDITTSAQELKDIQALENIPLVVVQAPGNTYFGTANWTFNVADKAFDFLGAGDTLTLTYKAEVDSNYGGGNLAGFANFTITITGTNDAPVITTGPEKVAFINVGTTTTGPNLPPPVGPTTNKLTFNDPDLTDTHTVSADLTAATLSGNGAPTLDMQALEAKYPRPMGVFEGALSAAVTTDSTGTGNGTITWTLADISAYYADIVPAGETLTLTYTVTVKDSQGATSSQNVIVTILGSEPPAVVWVETTADALTDPAPGDWNGAHNWETGTVPKNTDDVSIITDQLQGQTPFYPVTVHVNETASANSVTMDDFNDLAKVAPELDVGEATVPNGATNGELSITAGLSLSADSILKVFGTLSVGTIATILGNSVLDNSGFITLGQGGQFGGSSSITNSGTIEVVSDELDVQVNIANSGGIIQIDPGATLKLNGAEIIGGTITDNNTIDVTGSSKIDSGATLNNGAVTVEPGVTLTLDGMTVNGTTITDKGTIVLSDTVKLEGSATLDGVSGSALGAIINNGTLEVAGAAELLNDTLTNTSGIIQVDDSQTLTLSGTEVIGGIINDFNGLIGGKIDVTGNSKIDSGATLNNGVVTVEPGVTLTLDSMTVNGTTITDKGTIVLDGTVQLEGSATIEGVSGSALGAITNNGTLEVAGAAELLNDTLTNTSGIVQVDALQTLTLNGTEIIGGIITDVGKIDVTGASKIDGSATLNSGGVTVEPGVTLTLDGMTVNGTTITDKGTIVLDDTVKLTGSATLEGVSGSALGAITNNGTLEVAGAAELLDDMLTNTSGIIRVDALQTLTLSGTGITGGMLTNSGTLDSISTSTIDDAGITNTGLIESTGGVLTIDPVAPTLTLINSGTLEANGGELDITTEPVANTGTLQAIGGGTLKLTSMTVTNAGGGTVTVGAGSTLDLVGTSISANIDGGTVGNSGTIDNVSGTNTISADITNTGAGTVTVAGGSTLTLANASITGGAVTDNGTIGITGASTLAGVTFESAAGGTDTIDNTGTLTLGSGGLTLGGSEAFTLALDGAGALALNGQTIQATTAGMTLENDGNTISGAGQIGDGTTKNLTLDNASGVIEALGGTLKIATGNDVTNAGTLQANGAILQVTTKVFNSGLIEATGGGTLDLQGGSLGEIIWTGATPLAGSNGIVLASSADTLLVDSSTGQLQLAGTTANGAVSLGGGTIKGIGTTAETLDNFNNVISGDGHIGVGTDLLTLHNESAGTIDANVSGQMISIDTVASGNAGTIEATLGGEINFAGGDITNSNALTASDGSKLAFSNETIANTGTIHLDGSASASQIIIHGTLTLDGGDGSSTGPGQLILTGDSQNAILSDLSPATLHNVDNTISGSGSIGDADLTVQNDQFGVIDATGVLALNAVTTTNAGTLEATSGGTLQIENSVSNTGTIEADGGTVFVDSTATITGNASVTITAGGVAEFAGGSSTQALDLNATFSGSGTLVLENSQHYGGTISGFNAGDKIDLTDLAYSSSETDVWNSTTNTLTITSGSQTESLKLAGTFDQNSFALTNDGHGDTEVLSNSGGLGQPQASVSGLDSAGNAVDGDGVLANLSPGNGNPGLVTYTWVENGQVVQDGTSNVFTPGAADIGKVLDVVVGFGSEQITAVAGTVATPPAVNNFVNYANFNGSNAAIGSPTTDHVGNGANDGATLEGWVNWNGQGNTGSSQLLFYNGSTSDAGFGVNGVVTANGLLDLQIQTGGIAGIDTGVTLAAGQWHDVALTHVGGIFTLYVDGVADYTINESVNGIPGNHPDFTMIGGVTVSGSDFGGEGFTGSIADVSAWNVALTQAQVATTNFTSLSGTESGLTGYWPLNDGSGGTASDHGGSGTDNLSFLNTPSWVANGAGLSTNENTPLTLNSLNVSFADAGSDTITVTLDASHGTLSLASAGAVTEGGVGTGALTLSGTLATIDAALGNGLVYTPNTDFAGIDNLSVEAYDGVIHSNTANVTINVAPVAQAPVLSGPLANIVSDSLTGTTIDSTKWHVVLPTITNTGDNDSSVTPSSNGVVLHDHGYLDTVAGFTPTAATPLNISLSFTLDSGGGYVAVTDGTDGTINPTFGAPANGLSFMFDWNGGVDVVNDATGQSQTIDATFSGNTLYDVSITDNGSSQTFQVTDDANGQVVASGTTNFTDYAAGNLVTITNREDNDNPHTATVSHVSISSAYEGTEGGSVTLSGITASVTDPHETLTLVLSGFQAGTTFSEGALATSGAYAGDWVISNQSEIAALATTPLTMTTAAGYSGTFNLAVEAIATDTATLTTGIATSTSTATQDFGVKVDAAVIPPVMSFTTIDDPGATATYAYGINNAGQIVGEATANPNNEVGWEYSAGAFTAIGVVGDQDNGARGINNLGEVVGSDSPVRSTPRYGLVDINGTDTQINLPPGVSSGANGVNDAGVVVGQSYLHTVGGVTPVYTGYIDDHGTVTYLNAPGTLTANGYTAANGINNAGQVVGDYETTYGSNDQGFLYNGSSYTTISDPLGVNGTVAEGINDNGVIVGFFTDASNKQHGFIDNNGVFTTIDNPLGVNGTSLNGINNAGEVVGNYVDANNVTHGFVANPTVTINVLTPNGLDFQHHNALVEMGAGAIQSGGSSTSFTIVDSADNLEFVLDGNNFTYGTDGNGGITVTGGTLTSFHEFTNDATPIPLADFTGLLVNAATWISDVQLAAGGNHTAIDTLTSAFAYNFVGGSGPDNFGSAGHADTLSGTGKDFFDGGGAPAGSHDTSTGGAGSTFVFAQGYGALTITNFDQASGTFHATDGDQIQLNGLTAPTAQNVSYANGNAILDFGNGDVVTLLHVTQTQYEGLGGTEFSTGGNGNDGGGNNGGPVIDDANNIVTYTGTPVVLDPSISVVDTTGTVTSVDAWISSGAQTGDALTINGNTDGTLTDSDGSTIHYHFDGNAIDLEEGSGSSSIPTLDDFNAALQLIEFSPGAADGARTITWAAHEAVNTSPTVTTTVDVGPVLNSFALTVSQGGTDVLTPGDFSVTHAQSTDFYSVQNATGGQFEVFNGSNWVAATTGGFNDTQIAAGQVEFVQDGTATVPNFSISVGDGTGNVSPAISPTVNFTPTETVADGATYTISAPSAEAVLFAGSTGTLDLVHPSTFSGVISNFAGTAASLSSSDAIDLVGFNAADTTVTSAVYAVSNDTGTTAVTVTDSSGDGLSTVLNFSGNDPASMFKIGSSSDGAYLFDPPATITPAPAATSTIVATAPNQILTGNAASDTFAFNFTGVGHATVTDFHPATDTLQFSSPLFANLQAALNATHDDGHGNTVVALDATDTITLNGILKAQLQASDFHFV
jgi:probable HAF family extracellular repeat protein